MHTQMGSVHNGLGSVGDSSGESLNTDSVMDRKTVHSPWLSSLKLMVNQIDIYFSDVSRVVRLTLEYILLSSKTMNIATSEVEPSSEWYRI
jgi:hypothetical protein